MSRELIKDKKELEQVADLLFQEIKNQTEDIISRYIYIVSDSAFFINGQKFGGMGCGSNLNKERIQEGIYTQTGVPNLFCHNLREVSVARDLQNRRFTLHHKGRELPKQQETYMESIPSGICMYDNEFKKFTKEYKNTTLVRTFTVEQRIIVNSKGGKAIQTIPFLGISYTHGYAPIPTSRDIAVVCTSEKDIKRLPSLIKYIADPTLDKKIKRAESFSQAFHELYKISGLKFGSLEDAGIPLSELYDVIMLTGAPVHEIFGHHFEEPIRFLDFGESGTFKYGQNIQNKDIVLLDNPQQRIEGFRVQGFTYVDAYGRKREQRVHIKNGEVVGFLGGEYADLGNLKKYLNLEKSEFIGNASQYTDGQFPQPRMSCTVINGPTENVNLEGKILVVPQGGYTNPQDKTYVVRAYEAYVMKNGEPRRIIPLQVTGGINQALANLVLLDDFSYQTGMCTKNEAQVPVSQFTRSQIWKGQQVYSLPISDVHLKVLMG